MWNVPVSVSVRININTLIHVRALDRQETLTHFICGYYGSKSISPILIAVDNLFILIFCNQGLFFSFYSKETHVSNVGIQRRRFKDSSDCLCRRQKWEVFTPGESF